MVSENSGNTGLSLTGLIFLEDGRLFAGIADRTWKKLATMILSTKVAEVSLLWSVAYGVALVHTWGFVCFISSQRSIYQSSLTQSVINENSLQLTPMKDLAQKDAHVVLTCS